jgi:hypothetical protein
MRWFYYSMLSAFCFTVTVFGFLAHLFYVLHAEKSWWILVSAAAVAVAYYIHARVSLNSLTHLFDLPTD